MAHATLILINIICSGKISRDFPKHIPQHPKHLRKFSDNLGNVHDIFNAPANPHSHHCSPVRSCSHSSECLYFPPSSLPAALAPTPHQSSNCGRSPLPPSPLTSPSTNTSTTVHKHIQSDDSSSLAPTGKLKWLEWNNNQKPTGHPKVHDHVPEIYHLIMLAIREFSVCVCTQNALPDPEVQITWANEVWTNTCKMVEEEYEVTDCVISLVSSSYWFLLEEPLLLMDFCQIKTHTSNAHAPIKDAMRPLIEVALGLKKTSITTSKQACRNIK